MKVESYLDYNEILKIAFEISDDDIEYNIFCQYGNERLKNKGYLWRNKKKGGVLWEKKH